MRHFGLPYFSIVLMASSASPAHAGQHMNYALDRASIGCLAEVAEGSELIVVEMTGLVGEYPLGASREATLTLGFSLFEINGVSIRWAGSITTGASICSNGSLGGVGADFFVSFVPEVLCFASHAESLDVVGTSIPFDDTDSVICYSDRTFGSLMDGVSTLHLALQGFFFIPECGYTLPFPSGILDSVLLMITARRMHDFDHDGRVTLSDAGAFADCVIGPNGALGLDCPIFDQDRNVHVDLLDVAAFQRAFTGS